MDCKQDLCPAACTGKQHRQRPHTAGLCKGLGGRGSGWLSALARLGSNGLARSAHTTRVALPALPLWWGQHPVDAHHPMLACEDFLEVLQPEAENVNN